MLSNDNISPEADQPRHKAHHMQIKLKDDLAPIQIQTINK